MKAPYRVGFEIVHHNDDNTRLVGIFVFRVNKDLYFAPVFFINGNIKGTDLFYRHATKSFVPLNERWLEYLISLSESSEGTGVPISERTNTRRQLNLQNVVMPPAVMTPANYKYASTDPADLHQLATDVWAEIKSAAIPALPTGSILRRFIINDGGFHAINKIKEAAQADRKFAEALLLGSKPENYLPEIDPVKAASAPTPWLTLHLDALRNPAVKSASAADLHQGYVIEDSRPKEAVNEVIYDANERNLESVTQPGVYKVLVADGSTHEMICAYFHRFSDHSQALDSGCEPGPAPVLPFAIIETDSKKSKNLDCLGRNASRVLGMFQKELSADLGESKPTAGKLYRILNLKSKSLSQPIHVTKVNTDDLGLTTVEFGHGFPAKTITLNPDYDGCDSMDQILGSCCRWVEIKTEDSCGADCLYADTSIELGNTHAVNEFIYRQGFKKAAVRKSSSAHVVWLNASNNTPGAQMSKLAAKCALMTHCALREADVDEILNAADEHGHFSFYYEPAEQLATKAAHNLRFPQFPEFYDTMNSDYNVQEQPQPSRIMVQAERDLPYIEKHRIGDKMTFDSGDNMDTQTPMSLYNLSQQRGVGSLFEHGVVGSLTQTFDSAAIIDTYTPDLLSALDRLGRIMFLFYWKPEDFAQAFGSDDQTQLENKLVSNFKSFGDLVIELLQKTKRRNEGSVGLS